MAQEPSTVPQIQSHGIPPLGLYANQGSSYFVPTSVGGGGGGGGVTNPLTANLVCDENNITGANRITTNVMSVFNADQSLESELQISGPTNDLFGIAQHDSTGINSVVIPFALRGDGARPYQNYTAVMNSVSILPGPDYAPCDGLLSISADTGTTTPSALILVGGSNRDIYEVGGFYINNSNSNIMACPPGADRQVRFPGFVSTPTIYTGAVNTNGLTASATGTATFNGPVAFNSNVTFAIPPPIGGLTPRTTLFYDTVLSLNQTIPTPTGEIQGDSFTAPTSGVYIIQWTLQYSPGNTTAGPADAFNCVIYQTDQGTNVPKARASIPVLGLSGTVAYPSWTSMTVLDTFIAGENYTPQSLIYNRSGTLATTLVWNLAINITSLC
jgi:hypothetical protein